MVDDEVGFVVLHHGQEGGHVEAAEVQEEAFECEGGDFVEQVQADQAGEMAAGGLATGEEKVAAELAGAVFDEVFGGVVAVFCAGGPGVFGCEAVADGYDGEIEVVGHVFEVGVLAV